MSCDLCYGIYNCPCCGDDDDERDELDVMLDIADDQNEIEKDLKRLENEQD